MLQNTVKGPQTGTCSVYLLFCSFFSNFVLLLYRRNLYLAENFYEHLRASQKAPHFAYMCLDRLGDNTSVFETVPTTSTLDARWPTQVHGRLIINSSCLLKPAWNTWLIHIPSVAGHWQKHPSTILLNWTVACRFELTCIFKYIECLLYIRGCLTDTNTARNHV